MFSVDRLEQEANRFAVDFIYGDEELRDFVERPVLDVASYMGVPINLAKYRINSVKI